MDYSLETIDCACVIHGDGYSWNYVERLYAMLCRHLTPRVRLHVYTEAHRPVPEPFVKHELTEWPEVKPSRAWWYKMQLFDLQHHSGDLLYFDLDTVIVKNIDWIWQLSTDYLWAIRDFKYIWNARDNNINSSVMWWNTQKYHHVWTGFNQLRLTNYMLKHRGDQDYISATVNLSQRRFFALDSMQSWRWQCLDGGYNFQTRRYQAPGQGTKIGQNTSVLVFHGKPKPQDITDPVVLDHWRL